MTHRYNPFISFRRSAIFKTGLILTALMLLTGVAARPSSAELKPLNQAELKAVTGGGAVDFSIIGDTARIYFDVHIETYAEIDSVKLGYYERHDFATRKFLAPEDPMVVMSSDEKTFRFWNYINGSNPANGSVPAGKVPVYYRGAINYGKLLGYTDPPGWKGYGGDASYWTLSLTPGTVLSSDFRQGTATGYNSTTPFNSYIYTESDGVTKHYIPYTVNSNYQTKYNNTLGERYIEGLQGVNDESLLGVDHFSSSPSANNNVYDWDINIENLRLGEGPENPMVIDGVVLMLKYDDITSPNKKLTDIIIGTNCMEGDLYGDMIRMTGFLSPKLPQAARNGSLESLGHFSWVFNEAPVPVVMTRDSFLMLVDHYRFEYCDPDPGLDDKLYPAIVNDPTSNNMHTASFLRLGLDPDSPNFGFALVMGYNEIVASTYKPTEFIHQSLKNWWD